MDLLLKDGITVVEYDGCWWHRDTMSRDIEKTMNLLKAGFRVVRVRENDLTFLPPMVGLIQVRFEYHADSLSELASEILKLTELETL